MNLPGTVKIKMKFMLLIVLTLSACYTKAELRSTNVPTERIVACPMGDAYYYQAHDSITRAACLQTAINACGQDRQVIILDDTPSMLRFKCL